MPIVARAGTAIPATQATAWPLGEVIFWSISLAARSHALLTDIYVPPITATLANIFYSFVFNVNFLLEIVVFLLVVI